MTKLSDATIEKLADALFSEALTYIETDEEYIETVVRCVSAFLRKSTSLLIKND